MTNNLDGSEDRLVSEKIFTSVGEAFLDKRNDLIQNTLPRLFQQLIRMIAPPIDVRQKAIANDKRPEGEREELCYCAGNLLDVASIDLDQIEFDMMIEEDDPQSENNEVMEQQKNQNEQRHQSKQPLYDINLEVANNHVKYTEGRYEIHKDAIFLLKLYKLFKDHQNNISSEFNHCLAHFNSAYQVSKKRRLKK